MCIYLDSLQKNHPNSRETFKVPYLILRNSYHFLPSKLSECAVVQVEIKNGQALEQIQKVALAKDSLNTIIKC